MLVYADFDKTQCYLKIAADKKMLITTELEESFDTPVFLHGETSVLAAAVTNEMKQLYDEVKSHKYFVMLKEEWTK